MFFKGFAEAKKRQAGSNFTKKVQEASTATNWIFSLP
jgi:hypothetical protein